MFKPSCSISSMGLGMATASMAMLVLVVVAGPSIHAQSQPQGDPQSCGAPGHAGPDERGRGHAEHGNGFGLGHCGPAGVPAGDAGTGDAAIGGDDEASGDVVAPIDVASVSAPGEGGSGVSVVSDSIAAVGGGGVASELSGPVEEIGAVISADGAPIGVVLPGAVTGLLPVVDEPIAVTPVSATPSAVEPTVVEPNIVEPPQVVDAVVEGGIEGPPSIVVTPVAGELLDEAVGPVIPATPTPVMPSAMPNTGTGGLADASTGASGGTLALAVAGLVAVLWVGLMVVGRRIAGRVGRGRIAARY